MQHEQTYERERKNLIEEEEEETMSEDETENESIWMQMGVTMIRLV